MKNVNQLLNKSAESRFSCSLCRFIPSISPIQLICFHLLCYDCGKSLQRQEIDRYMQSHFKITCPACTTTTMFTDIKNLLIPAPTNSVCKITIKENQAAEHQDFPSQINASQQCNQNVSATIQNSLQHPNSIFHHHHHSTNSFKKVSISPERVRFSESKAEIYNTPKRSERGIEMNESTIITEKLQVLPNQEVKDTLVSIGDKEVSSHQFYNEPIPNLGYEICDRIKSSQIQNPQGGTLIQQNTLLLETPKRLRRSLLDSQLKTHLSEEKNLRATYFDKLSHGEVRTISVEKTKETFIDKFEKQKKEIMENKYSYFSAHELSAKLTKLYKQLEGGIPLKCSIHNDYSILYDTLSHNLRCPMCVFDEKKQLSNFSSGWGEQGKITPAKTRIDLLKHDVKEWELSLEKKMEEIDKSIQTTTANQGILRESFSDESKKLKNTFDDMRQKLTIRENELADQFNKRYQEENEHLRLVIQELQPISDNMRKVLRSFKNNTQLDENINLYYYHTLLRTLKDSLSFLKREPQQLYQKQNTQILDILNRAEMVSLIQKLGHVQSFALKGLEEKILQPTILQTVTISSRSISPKREELIMHNNRSMKQVYSNFFKAVPGEIREFEYQQSIPKYSSRSNLQEKVHVYHLEKSDPTKLGCKDSISTSTLQFRNSGTQQHTQSLRAHESHRRQVNQSYLNFPSQFQRVEKPEEVVNVQTTTKLGGFPSYSQSKSRFHRSIDFQNANSNRIESSINKKSISPKHHFSSFHHN